MKLKQWLAAILIGLTALVPLTGCGQTSDANTVTISRWALEWEKSIFEDWTKAFTAQNPDITIKWDFLPYTSHFDRMRTDLLSGTAADIIFVNNWGWKPYSNIDVFEDLGQVEALRATREALLPSAQSAFTQGDKVVGLPIGLCSRVPIVNVEDFDTAGVPVPYDRTTSFTAKELTDLLGTVADNSNRAMGINMTLTDALYMLCASVGAPVITADNKIGCNTPAGIAAVEQFRVFATGGRVVPLSQSQGGSFGTSDTAIMTGQVVSSYTNPGGFKSLLDAGYQIAAIPAIKAEKATGIETDPIDVVLADFNALVVPKFSKSKDAVYRVLNWMLGKEAQLQYTTFSDLPTNAQAFDAVMTDSQTWDPKLYAAYGVGIDNLYVPPALSIDFQTLLGGTLKNLVDGAITAEQFCAKLAAEGPQYL